MTTTDDRLRRALEAMRASWADASYDEPPYDTAVKACTAALATLDEPAALRVGQRVRDPAGNVGVVGASMSPIVRVEYHDGGSTAWGERSLVPLPDAPAIDTSVAINDRFDTPMGRVRVNHRVAGKWQSLTGDGSSITETESDIATFIRDGSWRRLPRSLVPLPDAPAIDTSVAINDRFDSQEGVRIVARFVVSDPSYVLFYGYPGAYEIPFCEGEILAGRWRRLPRETVVSDDGEARRAQATARARIAAHEEHEQTAARATDARQLSDARLREMLGTSSWSTTTTVNLVATELLAARERLARQAARIEDYVRANASLEEGLAHATEERDAAIARCDAAIAERDEAKAEAVEIIHDLKAQLAARPTHAWSDAEVIALAKSAHSVLYDRASNLTEPSPAMLRMVRHILAHAAPPRASAVVDVEGLARYVWAAIGDSALVWEHLTRHSQHQCSVVVEHVRDAVLAAQAPSPAVAWVVEMAREALIALDNNERWPGTVERLRAALAELDGAK